jgi:hypothetical protein
MKSLRERQAALYCVPVLLLLAGCGEARPDCDAQEVRDSVTKTVSNNSDNALVDFAINTSDALKTKVAAAGTEADKSAIMDKARKTAVYKLADAITTNSKEARAVTCSGAMLVTVEGETVQKMVDYKVDQGQDGKLAVSVSPFKFDPSKNNSQ